MARRSQTTLFIIVGLFVILLVGILIAVISSNVEGPIVQEAKKAIGLSSATVDVQSYVEDCIDFTVKRAMEDTGISPDTVDTYVSLVDTEIVPCSQVLFDRLDEQGYDVESGQPRTHIDINDDSLVVSVDYNITLTKSGQKSEFNHFVVTFPRTNWVSIPGGETQAEVIVPSTDGRAQLIIPAGVKITDQDRNPVTSISLKVDDVHFGGHENGVVLGNLVFVGQPSGAQFSQPVMLTLAFRDQDVPDGVAPENMAISWWDDKFGIWRGLPSTVSNGKITTMITHFTPYADTACDYVYVRSSPNIFIQRYTVYDGTEYKEDGNFYDSFIPDINSPIASKYPVDHFIDFFDGENALPGIDYGSINNGDFTSCTDNPNYVDDNGDFKMDTEKFEMVPCVYTPAHPDQTDPTITIPEEGDPACGNDKNPGNPCGSGKRCLQDPGQKTCTCTSNDAEPDNSFGYPKASCVGGIREGTPDNQYVHCQEFEPDGNGCIMSTVIMTSYDPGDSCVLKTKSGNDYDQVPASGSNGMKICIFGVDYINYNLDSQAHCRVQYYVQGNGVKRSGNTYII